MFFWQNDKYAEEDFPGSKNNPCAFESPWNVDAKNNLRITILPWLERPRTINVTRLSLFLLTEGEKKEHYYTILVGAVHTIQGDVLIEGVR